MEDLMTPAEVAAVLKVKPDTVLKMIRQRRIPGFKFGKLVRIRREDMERWLEEKAQEKEV